MTYERPGSVSRLGLAAEAALSPPQPLEKTTILVPINSGWPHFPLKLLFFLSPGLCVMLFPPVDTRPPISMAS
jgi:hypothetical protein